MESKKVRVLNDSSLVTLINEFDDSDDTNTLDDVIEISAGWFERYKKLQDDLYEMEQEAWRLLRNK